MSQGRDPHESENFLQFIVDMRLYRDSSVCSRITCYLVIVICVCNSGLFLQSNQSTMIAPCCPPQTHIPPALSFTSCEGISTLWDKATSFIWALTGGGSPTTETLARKWCLHSLAFRPAINSPVCSTPLSGASGNKGCLICSSRMLQDAVTSETFNFYLPLWFPVHFLHPKKEPSSFLHARNLPLGHFCILFTLAYRTTNLNSLKILASAKEIHIFKTTFFSSGY